MFNTPKTSTFVDAAEAIDVDERYIVTLHALSDEGVSQFATDPLAPDAPHNIKWQWIVKHQADGRPILDVDGKPWLLNAFTSSKTGKAKGKVAKAREWMEALYGRELENTEIQPGFEESLIGKSAIADFESKQTEPDIMTGKSFTRYTILRLRPVKGGSAPMPQAVAVAPVAAPIAPNVETPAEKRARLAREMAELDTADVPF